MSYYTFIQQPKYAGMYCLGGEHVFCIYLVTKPKWPHRKMMLWCFGWEWRDAK